MKKRLKILLLAGTREAREIAMRLPEHTVTASLAGATRSPRELAVPVRRGGFGGVDGLMSYLQSEGFDLLIDATHPFAQVMTRNAETACCATGTRIVHILRPEWSESDGDIWQRVASLGAAAKALPKGGRVFLATGSRSLAHFAARRDVWFLARVIDAPDVNPFSMGHIVADRPPFSVDHEVALMRAEDITHLVARNAGGIDGTAKLIAARRLGLPVVLVDRPPPPAGNVVSTVAEALAYVDLIAEGAR